MSVEIPSPFRVKGSAPVHAQTQPILWVLLLALLLRLSLFLVIAPHPDRFYSRDAREYVALGKNLRAGYIDQGDPRFSFGLLRTPGYPLIIAAGFSVTQDGPWGVILFQIAVGVLTVWLTYRLAFRLVGSEPAVWAAVALAIDPISVILANYLQPETVFTFLLVAGTLMWSRGLEQHSSGAGAGAGALFGIAVLVRPIGLYLPAALIPASWLLHGERWTRRLIFTMVLFLLFALPVGGWIARNASVTGIALISTSEGYSLLEFRAAIVLAEAEGLSLDEAHGRLVALLNQRVRPGMNPAEINQLRRSLALEVLLDHPVAALATIVKGATLMMVGPGRAELLHLLGDPTPREISGPVQILLITSEVVLYAIVLIGGIVGGYLLWRKRMYFAAVVPLSIILYFILASLVSAPHSRFRVPIMPFIAIFAGYAFADWRRRSRADRTEEERPPTGFDSEQPAIHIEAPRDQL